MSFSKDFLFGLANADHQVESYDPRYPDVWDLWEETQGKTPRKEACKFQERYPEDIKLAADLGTKVFRFSVSWAKVQQSDHEWNREALAHYRAVAQCIKDHGMKVMVTLVHFTWPVWVERDHGGLLAPSFPMRFAQYATTLAEEIGDLVDYWISFNEPTQLVHGYIKTWWQEFYYMPPGMPEGTDACGEAEAVGKLIYNLFSAHAKARVAIKEHKPEAKVGVNPLVTGFAPWLQFLMDHQVHSTWLLKAMYRFSYSRPLLVEKTAVDLLICRVESTKQDTLLYSREYKVDGERLWMVMPAGHHGLLEVVNLSIAQILGEQKSYVGPSAQALSLADYFASLDERTPATVRNGEGLKRMRRRGGITVGSCHQSPQSHSIAKLVTEKVFGDSIKLEWIDLPEKARFKALSTKGSFINKAWHFFGAAGLIANANWWYLGSRGKLPEELCPAEAIGAHDFVGLDYYWGLPTSRLHQFGRLLDAAEGRFLNAPVWPEGLGHALRRFHKWFPDQELMIIENGSVPLADGYRRQDYLTLHLREVEKACEQGIPVTGYLLWSLTSNREWGHAFDHNTDFGLYRVDLDGDPELKRIASPEVQYYKQAIAQALGINEES